jgi:hypothetical protein
MGENIGTTRAGGRSDAAAMIAELWAEREETIAAPPARKASIPEAEGEPKPPRAGGRERALATLIVVLLAGAGLGIGAKAAGLIGAPSKASFLTKADAICATGNPGVSSLSKPVGYSSVATAASTLAANTDSQLAQLRTLDLPGRSDRNAARGVLNAISATGDAGRSLQSAAAASDPAMTALASRSMTLNSQDAATRAQAFGLTSCVAGMKPGIDAVVAGANSAVKTSFTEKATVACLELLRAAEALPRIRNATDLSRHIDSSVAMFEKLATDLKALPVPPGDEATVIEITTQIGNVSATIRQMGSAALAGDTKRVNALDKEGDAMIDLLNEKFGAYGLTACGE